MLVKVLVLNPISHGTEDFCDIQLVDDSLGDLPLLRHVNCSQLHEYLNGADSVETNFELSGNNLVMVDDQPYFPNRKPVKESDDDKDASSTDFDPNNIFGKTLEDWYHVACGVYDQYCSDNGKEDADYEEVVSLDDFKADLEELYAEVVWAGGGYDELDGLLDAHVCSQVNYELGGVLYALQD